MNKFIFSALFCFAALSMGAQSATQWSLFTKVTADWCPRCGTWGWEMMEQTMEELEGKNAFAWTLHYSGGLFNQTAEDLKDNLQTFSQPVFFVNDDDQGVLANNYPSKVTEVVEVVDLLSSLGSSVAVNVDAQHAGNQLQVEVDVEFVTDVTGEYYLGVYLVEDNVVGFQASIGNDANHPNVLREALTSTSFGPNIVNDPSAGFRYEESFTHSLPLGQGEDLEDWSVVAIVWNLNVNDQYRMFNLGVDQASPLTSSISDTELRAKFNISAINNQINIKTDNGNPYGVTVYDLNGKKVFTSTENGSAILPIAANNTQMYLVEIQYEGSRFSEKVFIK